ncbi:MAG: hypothetical protein SFV51_23820 [Bryobacteraceae bacterium]|nr:hypothetical protein [Bryobacteraceae bacterium]
MALRTVFFATLAALCPLSAVELPVGTQITVRMIDSIDSARNMAGQSFRGTLDEPLLIDGAIVIDKGSAVTARLEEAEEAGRFRGRSILALVLTSITHHGRPVELRTYRSVSSGGSSLKRTGLIVGGAAAAGAVIGGVATGGVALGALAGAGGGGAFRFLRKAKPMRIPSESRVKFSLAYPLSLE